ncbi:hypothetical protein IPN35_01635 [Candidatus Peregrinibacteria bacterium]|nr:MAG: hypothetical protein IPN35_01635 [Candidatus Peregrinibacteria bacterium]
MSEILLPVSEVPSEPYHKFGRGMQKILTIILIFAVFIFAIAFFSKGKLPEYSEIHPSLMFDPEQIDRERSEFSFEYREKTIYVKPRADYTINALVMSRNNISSLADSYHNNDSVDVRDICVMWGENLSNRSYQHIKVWNTSWTCYWKYNEDYGFQSSRIANNHLIASDPDVREQILSIREGDQVHLQGMLVDYGTTSEEYTRETSLSRTDVDENSRGGGACEVFYVNAIEILHRSTPTWYFVFWLFQQIIISCLALKAILFLLRLFLEKRKSDRLLKMREIRNEFVLK